MTSCQIRCIGLSSEFHVRIIYDRIDYKVARAQILSPAIIHGIMAKERIEASAGIPRSVEGTTIFLWPRVLLISLDGTIALILLENSLSAS